MVHSNQENIIHATSTQPDNESVPLDAQVSDLIDEYVDSYSQDDMQLKDRLANGDLEAAGELHRRYQQQLVNRVARKIGSIHTAEDIVSETFFQIMQSANCNKLRPALYLNSTVSLLHKSVNNKVIDTLKKPSYSRENIELGPEEHDRLDTSNIDMAVDDTVDMRDVLLGAINLLTNNQREVVFRYFYRDMSHAELAAEMNKTVEASKALLFRALDALRVRLGVERGDNRYDFAASLHPGGSPAVTYDPPVITSKIVAYFMEHRPDEPIDRIQAIAAFMTRKLSLAATCIELDESEEVVRGYRAELTSYLANAPDNSDSNC